MTSFNMPSLGADMDKGTVVDWRIKPGDHVERGEIVAEVETDKGVMEVEIWQSGTIEEICVPVGTEAPVGTPLARLHLDAEVLSPEDTSLLPQAKPALWLPSLGIPSERGLASTEPSEPSSVQVAATPLARRIAKEKGLDLSTLKGTGPHGAISRYDVEMALERQEALPTEAALVIPARSPAAEGTTPPAQPTPQPTSPLDAMRQAIARSMERSKREIPHYSIKQSMDLSALTAALNLLNQTRSAVDQVLPIAAIVRAVALACEKIPEVNGFWRNGRFEPAKIANVGLAVSLRGGGLVAPALLDPANKSVDTLMKEILDLVARARRGKLRASEMSEPTITLTSLGDKGVDEVTGVIYPPQVALVGVGRIARRPWASGDMIGVHPVAKVTLVADHRASDGHLGSLYLSEVERLLCNPFESHLIHS